MLLKINKYIHDNKDCFLIQTNCLFFRGLVLGWYFLQNAVLKENVFSACQTSSTTVGCITKTAVSYINKRLRCFLANTCILQMHFKESRFLFLIEKHILYKHTKARFRVQFFLKFRNQENACLFS